MALITVHSAKWGLPTCVRSCAALLLRLKAFAGDVTLDSLSHCNLIVSPEGKAVKLGATPQNVPETTKRF
jgi:hypothetical protein